MVHLLQRSWPQIAPSVSGYPLGTIPQDGPSGGQMCSSHLGCPTSITYLQDWAVGSGRPPALLAELETLGTMRGR